MAMSVSRCVSFLFRYTVRDLGRDISVGIATGYELDGSGIESRWERDFPHQIGPGAHPSSCTMSTQSFSG